MDRRSFLIGLGASLIAAPAIVRAASLMPVRGIVMAIDDAPFSKDARMQEFVSYLLVERNGNWERGRARFSSASMSLRRL